MEFNMKQQLYSVSVTYKFGPNHELDEKIQNLNKKKWSGSGYYFPNNMRDNSFHNLTKENANILAKKARKIKKVTAKIYKEE